jgi:hypothetical protein
VVSARQNIHPRIEEFPDHRPRHSDPSRSILPVGDDEIDVPVRPEPGQKFPHRPPAGLADHVTQE